MFKKINLLLPTVFLWFLTDLTAQSVYSNRDGAGLQIMGSVINSSNDLSGTSFGIGLSIKRKVDLAFSISDFKSNPGYYEPHEVIGGGIGFYPVQQWNDSSLTVGLFLSGTRSTLSGANGWTFLVGSAVTRELMLVEKVSLYPAASFSYAPYVSNRGDGSSFFSLESGISYKLADVMKLIFIPSLNLALNSNISSTGLSFGIVL